MQMSLSGPLRGVQDSSSKAMKGQERQGSTQTAHMFTLVRSTPQYDTWCGCVTTSCGMCQPRYINLAPASRPLNPNSNQQIKSRLFVLGTPSGVA